MWQSYRKILKNLKNKKKLFKTFEILLDCLFWFLILILFILYLIKATDTFILNFLEMALIKSRLPNNLHILHVVDIFRPLDFYYY